MTLSSNNENSINERMHSTLRERKWKDWIWKLIMEVLLCWVNCVLWFHCFACLMLAHTKIWSAPFAKLNHQIFRQRKCSKRCLLPNNVSQFSSINFQSCKKVLEWSWLTESHVGLLKRTKFIHLTTRHRSQLFKTITLERRHGNRVSMMLPLAFWFHLIASCQWHCVRACFEVEWVNRNKFSFNCCLFSSPLRMKCM